MKLLEPQANLLTLTNESLIEYAGRVCYRSEDRITEDSAIPFIKRLIDLGHESVLEHMTVYLKTVPRLYSKFKELKYFDVCYGCDNVDKEQFVIVATNARAIRDALRRRDIGKIFGLPDWIYYKVENNINDCNTCVISEREAIKYCPQFKRVSIEFVVDRGVTHEFVRHRELSPSQSSTRYCNYSNGKFGSELTFNVPYFWDHVDDEIKEKIANHLEATEKLYMEIVDKLKPQGARYILCNGLQATLVLSGFVYQWDAFLKLRNAKEAHPDAQIVAAIVQEYIDEIRKSYVM